MFCNAVKFKQTIFSIKPKTFYAVNVLLVAGKFIICVINNTMSIITHFFSIIIDNPTISIHDCVIFYFFLYYIENTWFFNIWYHLRIHFSATIENTQNNRFTFCATLSFFYEYALLRNRIRQFQLCQRIFFLSYFLPKDDSEFLGKYRWLNEYLFLLNEPCQML